MKIELKSNTYFKYSLEWFLTELDEIWELIEDKFQYNKKYKLKQHGKTTNNR